MKQKIYTLLLNILRFFTRIYLWRIKPFVIWITWSVGKTSCRMIIAQVLQQIQEERVVYTSPKNFNSELGLIFSIFQIEEYAPSIKNLLKIIRKIMRESIFSKKKYDILVAEYWIDSPGDMDFLLSVMKPNIWILTKLDSVHSDNFPGGVPQYHQDKFKLLLTSQISYLNAQDNFSRENSSLLKESYYIFDQDVWWENMSYEDGELKQSFFYKKTDISINLIWAENKEYTLLALKIGEFLGIQLSKQSYALKFFQQAGRLSIFERGKNIFIDSSYNASPESMKLIIHNTQSLREQVFPQKSFVYVLGDMREIGDIKKEAHENIASYILDAAVIFTVGLEMYQYMLPKLKELWYRGELHSSLSSREIGKKLKAFLKEHSQKEYIILVKGSQNTIFTEEVLAPHLTPTQQKNLPRQSEDWKKKKDMFFRSL